MNRARAERIFYVGIVACIVTSGQAVQHAPENVALLVTGTAVAVAGYLGLRYGRNTTDT